MNQKFILVMLLCLALWSSTLAQDYRCGQVSDADGWTNLRVDPSLKASVVTRVEHGQRVLITREEGDFYDCLLLYPDKENLEVFGFLHKSRVVNVRAAKGAGVVHDPDGWTNLRESASLSSPVLGTVRPADGFLLVLRGEGDFYLVETREGRRGYLHKSRLEWTVPRN